MPLTADTLRQRLLARGRLRHWLGFVRVADLGSVRKAAESIGIAQPALTSLLADLEALLGAPLFERHARGMRPTPLGRELLAPARRLLGAVDDMADQAVALQAQAQHVVRVGAIGGAVAGLLAPALVVLTRRHPDLLVQLLEADVLQLNALVARGEIDLALCRSPGLLPQGWHFLPLLQDRLVVLAGAGHALAGRRRLTLDLLRRQTWLVSPSGSLARSHFDTLFADGQPPLCQVSSRAPTVLWALLRAQPLLALVPASLARPLVEAGELVALSLDPALVQALEPIGALVADGAPPRGVDLLLAALAEVPPLAP